MIQAITYMTYWFTVAKTGKSKPFHQISTCSKTTQQISLTCSSPVHGVYGEHGAEFIHKMFRLLQITYCPMQPVTIRLQGMLKKEHSILQTWAKYLENSSKTGQDKKDLISTFACF